LSSQQTPELILIYPALLYMKHYTTEES